MPLPELRDTFWYGTQASYEAAVALEARAEERMRAGPFDDAEPNYLLRKEGNVGVVSIKGPLINSDHPIYAFFGVATYPAIRRALVAAATDSSIKSILLDVDSGGGSVAGVDDTAELIKRIDAKVKPVVTYSDTMASAALWLGITGRQRYASKTAIIGSIGVLMVHIDRTEQFKQEGLKATVIRSGKYKALLNPYEPLSDLAKAQVQEQIDAAYRVFGDHVASTLGMSFEAMDKKVGQGREFFGQKAVDAGLIDGIAPFDAILSALAEGKGVDKKRRLYDNGIKGASMAGKQNLTDADIAALAAGATASLEATAEEVAAAAAAGVTAELPADGGGEAVVGESDGAGVVAPAAEGEAAAAAPVEKTESELVAFLRAELKAKDEQILTQTLRVKEVEAQLATVEGTHSALLVIARGAIGNMRVALGSSAGDATSLEAVQAVAEHKRLAEAFSKKFKVGGVSVSSVTETKTQGRAVAADPLHKARVAAARP